MKKRIKLEIQGVRAAIGTTLRLDREVLRPLAPEQLTEVAGGEPTNALTKCQTH